MLTPTGPSFRSPALSFCVVAGLAGAATPMAAAASVVPVSQIRSVSADSFVVLAGTSDQDIHEIVSTGFGPFEALLATDASLANGHATFDVDQSSRFAPHGVIAAGSSVSTSSMFQNAGFCYSVGLSSAQLVFDVGRSSPLRVIATLTADANSQTKLLLNGPNGAVISKNLIGTDESLHLTQTLAPGRYTLTVSCFSSTSLSAIGTQTDAASFELFLSTSPSAQDLDLDGQVNAADLAALLGAWGPCTACPADFDQSGAVDSSDLAVLLGAWTGA